MSIKQTNQPEVDIPVDIVWGKGGLWDRGRSCVHFGVYGLIKVTFLADFS